MKKLSQPQQIALDKLIAIGKPSTSKEIKVQIITMQSLQKSGYVKPVENFGDDETFGRECESIHWQLTKNSK